MEQKTFSLGGDASSYGQYYTPSAIEVDGSDRGREQTEDDVVEAKACLKICVAIVCAYISLRPILQYTTVLNL